MNQPAAPAGQQQELNLRLLLQEMIQRGASDLHITVGNPAKIRIDGDLTDSQIRQVLAPKDTLSLAYSILTDNQKKRFETDDELDFSFGVQNLSRFRGNVYKQRGCVAMAIRMIPYEIISTEKLGDLSVKYERVVNKLIGRITGRGWCSPLTGMEAAFALGRGPTRVIDFTVSGGGAESGLAKRIGWRSAKQVGF